VTERREGDTGQGPRVTEPGGDTGSAPCDRAGGRGRRQSGLSARHDRNGPDQGPRPGNSPAPDRRGGSDPTWAPAPTATPNSATCATATTLFEVHRRTLRRGKPAVVLAAAPEPLRYLMDSHLGPRPAAAETRSALGAWLGPSATGTAGGRGAATRLYRSKPVLHRRTTRAPPGPDRAGPRAFLNHKRAQAAWHGPPLATGVPWHRSERARIIGRPVRWRACWRRRRWVEEARRVSVRG
jgi:hypothetical protein